MKKISDYIFSKTVIHCPTKELAFAIGKLLIENGIHKSEAHNWDTYDKDFCLSLYESGGMYCSKIWYEDREYNILEASDFLIPLTPQFEIF